MKGFIAGCVLACAIIQARAQVDIGAGAELGFPLMFNSFVKGHNHASAVPGARLAINYTPGEGSFTGSLIAGVAPMILPVVRFNAGQDVLYMNFTSMNLSLLGRFRKEMSNDAELLYGIGVGVNSLKGNRVQISKRSDNDIMRVIEDSSFYNKATLPAFYLNLEYIRPLKSNSKLYYGIGAQLHYIYFLDQGASYRVDMIDKNMQYFSLQPELKGHMLNPMVFVNLYYRLGKTGS
ncbi:MAG TPA: hypothetical protein VIN07_00995 [Flavipsychrobacter sp.]